MHHMFQPPALLRYVPKMSGVALWLRARRSLKSIMALLGKSLEVMCHPHRARPTDFMLCRHEVLCSTSQLFL